MQILKLHIDGLSALPKLDWHYLDHPTLFAGPTPQTSALCDALELSFAALSAHRLKRTLERWGWDPLEIIEEGGHVVECHWTNVELARKFVFEQPKPCLRVELKVSLNSDLLANIRRSASRNPAIQTALLEEPTLSFKLVFLFGEHRQFMRISISKIMIGHHILDISAEPPRWLPMIWSHLSTAFAVESGIDNIAERAAQAAFSVHEYDRYLSFEASLPQLSPLRLVRVGEKWDFLAAGYPIRSWGYVAERRLRHAALVYLSEASIVWLEGECACVQNPSMQLWGTNETASPLDVEPEKSGLLSFKS